MSYEIIPPGAFPVLEHEGGPALARAEEFFFAHIENPNTRAAYQRAVKVFFLWIRKRGLEHFSQVTPVVVSQWVQEMKASDLETATIKQRLAAVKGFLDYLATGGVIPTNPAISVRGPKYSATRGKTPVLTGAQAAQLLNAIDVTTTAGLRDRALIALMTYTFARIGAVTHMTVGDLFHERNRLWVRLHEKGGKRHEMPCHHTLEEYLRDYLEKTGLDGQSARPLFPSLSRSRELTNRPLHRVEAWAMVRRRAQAAGLKTAVVNHTFRATGITSYLENGGVLERARAMANHSSTRTTQLYDRRNDRATLDDVELIRLS
ncbi:integrase [Rhodomicrobium udaipurense JA643]|uniref:Tyrosine-type recombinase/integrase n=1 Tax=Rhodomicrobium udaipurense TaxID=1202716 RepID=A0A8I1GHV6_9HYPH|nr:tyrosine-type recombinase/integrase [Rhodomicrobium udaipurense]KAI94724.1 integrase [Rhodomicrobium udaipurense JA643]MBJ7545219.1 tyrosine-type recombinase/integrase [Rhodomicrobium udaipurense]